MYEANGAVGRIEVDGLLPWERAGVVGNGQYDGCHFDCDIDRDSSFVAFELVAERPA